MINKPVEKTVEIPVKLIRAYFILDWPDNTWLQRFWLIIRFIMVGKSRLPIGWKIQQAQQSEVIPKCQSKEDTQSSSQSVQPKETSEKVKSN